MMTAKKKDWIFATCLVVGALIMRLTLFGIFFAGHPLQLAFDSGHYHELAVNLIKQGAFVHNDGRMQFYRLPGYPLFLALWYLLFGIVPNYAVLAQIVLGSLLPLLIMVVMHRLFGTSQRTTRIAGIITAMHPGFMLFANMVMTETVFCLLVFACIAMVLDNTKKLPSKCALLCAGILLGLATLTRPLGVEYLCITLCFFALLHWHKQHIISGTTALCIGWLAACFWWPLRNLLLTGVFFLHTLPGPHMLNHGAVPIMMRATQTSHAAAQQKVYTQVDQAAAHEQHKKNRPLLEIERSRCMQRITVQVMWDYPFATLGHLVTNMIKTSCSLYSAELLWMDANGQLPPYNGNRTIKDAIKRFLWPEVHHPWIRWFVYAELLFNLLLFVGVLGGIFIMLYRGSWYPLLFIAFFVGCTVVLSGLCGYARLRLPIEPFFIMLASVFWSSIFQQKGVDAWRVKIRNRS